MRPMIFLLHHAPIVVPAVTPSGLFMPPEKFYSCFMETFGNNFPHSLVTNTLCFVPFRNFPKNRHHFGTISEHFVRPRHKITATEQQTLSHCRIILLSHSCPHAIIK